MMDKIIRVLGHEHSSTIWFIQFCEEHPEADNEKMNELLEAIIELTKY